VTFGIQKITKLNPVVSYAAGAAMGVITNTALVLGMILAFHFGSVFVMGETQVLIGWEWLSAIILGNFLIELAICTVVTPPIVFALKKAFKQI
jgi:uncharacterized membrane protein